MTEIVIPDTAGPDVPVGEWLCLPCIGDTKTAALTGHDPADLPPIRRAITLLNGTAVCYEHVHVQVQSPLAVPAGAITPGGGR